MHHYHSRNFKAASVCSRPFQRPGYPPADTLCMNKLNLLNIRSIIKENTPVNKIRTRSDTMSEFQELIKSFQKSRNYVRDFLVYGFKSRDDFTIKSGRTYDNERRRIESWLSEYIRTDYKTQGKTVSIALDSNLLDTNPLYRVWKSRSFTANDIMLHFFFLDLFHADESYTADELTNLIVDRYGVLFESQLVRKKANEYVKEGILTAGRKGRKLFYSLNPEPARSFPGILPQLLHAIRFCQLAAPFGFIGSTILDSQKTGNGIFLVKHGYCGFTLEDEILSKLLQAIREQRTIRLLNRSNRTARTQEEKFSVVPLQIFVSTRTGRRFLCGYQTKIRRFTTLRLDQIQNVVLLEPYADYEYYKNKLKNNLPFCFGVSFGISHEMDTVRMTLTVRQGVEDHIITRLEREGRGGTITRIEQDIWSYEITVFDGNELMPWIRTFIGRILSFESSNPFLCRKFYQDIREMAQMYDLL